MCRGGSGWSHPCMGVSQPSSAPIIPGEPNFPRVLHLRVLAYRVWGPVIQAPTQGCPNIVGGLPPPLLWGRIPPSPRGQNSCPSLTIIPISPLIYARPCSDSVGSAAASTLSPVLSPVIPSIVIRLVCRDSIVFVVVVVAALEISTLCTSYHQLPPPPIKKSTLSVASHAPF